MQKSTLQGFCYGFWWASNQRTSLPRLLAVLSLRLHIFTVIYFISFIILTFSSWKNILEIDKRVNHGTIPTRSTRDLSLAIHCTYMINFWNKVSWWVRYIYISIPITSCGACKGTSWQITFFSVCVNSSFGISNHKDFSQVEEIQLVCHPLYFTFQVFHSQQLSDRLPWNSNRHSWSWDDKALSSHTLGDPQTFHVMPLAQIIYFICPVLWFMLITCQTNDISIGLDSTLLNSSTLTLSPGVG